MKKVYKLSIPLLLLVTLITSCKKDLIRTNINPNAVTSVDPGLEFSAILVASTANQNNGQTYAYTMDFEPRTNYCHGFMQYGYSDFWSGTFYQYSSGITSRYWNSYYPQIVKNLEYLMPVLANRSDLVNTYAAAKIWRAFIYQKLTDFYGDVPYSQAGKAYSQAIFAPVYDHQEQIYDSLILELKTAVGLFSDSQIGVKGDQFYGGQSDGWKKLANSLLLRIGMRLIKVDAARASSLVKDAVAGGVMQGLADMPVLKHNASAPNDYFYNLGDQHFFLHKTLVDHMKNTKDPRLTIYGGVYDKAHGVLTSTDTTQYIGYSPDPAAPLPTVYVRLDNFQPANTPFFDFHYAQVEFLLAEAVLRGFITGDANQHYIAGVTAHMQSLAMLSTAPTITGGQISAYLAANPLNPGGTATTAAQIATINTEFWVSGFLFDADEVWANWRRTGYPALTPNPFTNASNSSSPGSIPRKMPYPESEQTQNTAAYTAAIAVYGGVNTFNANARVWWDKP